MGIVASRLRRQRIKKRRKEIEEKVKKGELHLYNEGLKYRDNLITFKDIYTSELNALDIASKRLDK